MTINYCKCEHTDEAGTIPSEPCPIHPAPEHLPSDHLLTRLRKRVEVARVVESNVSLHPDQVAALIECAKIVQTDYLLLSQDQQAKAYAVLAKLEAL